MLIFAALSEIWRVTATGLEQRKYAARVWALCDAPNWLAAESVSAPCRCRLACTESAISMPSAFVNESDPEAWFCRVQVCFESNASISSARIRSVPFFRAQHWAAGTRRCVIFCGLRRPTCGARIALPESIHDTFAESRTENFYGKEGRLCR